MPWPTTPPTREHRASYADAEPRPFWLREPKDPSPALTEDITADLCIVGAGFTGLWAALYAAEQGKDVVILEAETAGFGASGRNGGFAVASLTHGIENGLARFADEMPTLERLALENFEGIQRDLAHYGIDCDFQLTGELLALTDEHQLPWLQEEAEQLTRFGHEVTLLDQTAMCGQVNSPTYLGGVWDHTGAGILDPGKLAHGLKDVAVRKGVRLYEYSSVEHVTDELTVITPQGRVRADRVLLATSAYPPLINTIKHYVVPVYDYALMTEPIDMDKVGWQNRQGIGDGGNQFHYYRPTTDGRILYGGWDAVYRYKGPVGARYDDHDATFAKLAQHFFHTFPQLEGTRFTHRWGGAIDTSSRFSVFFGTSHGGRLAYATGYTGLGVAATRFGGRTAVDLLDGRDTDATRTRYVRTKPVPFPPEPLRYAVVQLTRNRLAAADRNQGRRGLWLRTLDRLGLGFDS
ncbi:FAD-dependent oxidoreductase [Solirubrobacter sp. CPCC 204708]|uniref:FAD-binding oxidoreductase n=1 Tax=Solirubrobacter deserti TaxID=2282478 RepID=A0ABT4RTC5_9ACTN|nr:FAD-dependent oxidoreductase [Solirubrobacter deserti]MBE2316207.1 FAD-dependent oxidoreductase [Solirubrobacter deserti]MDA0141833.1 FAD-binding oxidoreductase [Solirubrobacter deserti]